jgi:hypothetical protein
MAEERVRIEIGFVGGTILGAQVPPDEAERLQRKLEASGDGTVELTIEDGACVVVCAHVLYLKRFVRESRVGFGG